MVKQSRKPAGDTFHIRRREDFDLFCSPIRAAILEYLVAFGPMPAREIAARIGRSAALVHHHVGILLRGGLVREVSRVKRGKHLERIFAIGPTNWLYDFQTDPKAIAEGMLRIARTWGRHSERLLTSAFQGSEGIAPRMQQFITIRAETGRLSEKSAAAVREHLQAIRRIFEEDRTRSEGEFYQIFWSYFPLEAAANPGARRKTRGRQGAAAQTDGQGAVRGTETKKKTKKSVTKKTSS